MDISYEIIRSGRRTLSLQITTQGKVLVRCPNRMPKREIEAFLREKSHWLETHLDKIARQPSMPPLTEKEIRSLTQQAKERIPQRVSHFSPLVGVGFGRISMLMVISCCWL